MKERDVEERDTKKEEENCRGLPSILSIRTRIAWSNREGTTAQEEMHHTKDTSTWCVCVCVCVCVYPVVLSGSSFRNRPVFVISLLAPQLLWTTPSWLSVWREKEYQIQGNRF